MRRMLAVAAVTEAATGLLVLAFPLLAARLLFGTELAGAGILVARVAGIAIIGLAIACWPSASARQPCYGMLVYGTLVMLYLAYAALAGEGSGVLLWPAVVAHAIIVALLVAPLIKDGAGGTGRPEG
ncbi:MAG TPA: hypothetical protein VF420_12055 [Casimicrobiaceae bacterium]